MPTNRISRRGIALVPEGRQIYQEMSVEENMMMGTTPIGMFDDARPRLTIALSAISLAAYLGLRSIG